MNTCPPDTASPVVLILVALLADYGARLQALRERRCPTPPGDSTASTAPDARAGDTPTQEREA
ncbi:MAG TPA: hypothetical protein VJL59_21840 [Anaerolineales bacterium]|nr:hypothetical protein [Anaerolineales bacterium]